MGRKVFNLRRCGSDARAEQEGRPLISDKLTQAQEQCLRDQVITIDQPGPVLRDFAMLLEFLGPDGVEAAGKYNLLPIRLIPELDQRLTRPLHLKLKRPQIRSHPYLQGLNLLLRASGLGRVAGSGARTRLMLDREALAQWDQLNLTERYFNLLEAAFRLGRGEMVGQSSRSWGSSVMLCVQAWQSIPASGRRYDARKPAEVYVLGIGRDFYLLALMDLFGLVDVELPAQPGTTWVPAGVRHTPFGDAVFSLLTSRFDVLLGHESFLDEPVEDEGDEDDEEEEEDEDAAAPDVPRIGAWHPLFQPYFPEWQNNLTFAAPELRSGTYIFRVSLGNVWRLIATPAGATLDDLVSWILDSVDFDEDEDHLYKFSYRDHLGRQAQALHPAMDEGPWADEIPIGTVPLEPGQSMELVYDFGDNWRFTVKLEKIEPAATGVEAPSLLESHGKAPEQYPSWDD
jgi:hypothetical protein